MKRFTLLLLLATCAALTASNAQDVRNPNPPTGGSATDDAVNQMGGIRRPTPAPNAPAAKPNAPLPKKPLEATLSKDAEGKSATTTFAAASPKIYLQWKDSTAAKGDKLRVVWVAEEVAGISAKNKKLTETAQTLPGPGSYGTFFLPAAKGSFPVGKYRVELYENAKLAKSLSFMVK